MTQKTAVLYRTRSGGMVHRAECKRLGPRCIPWLWAEGRRRAEVKAAEVNGVKWCRVCKPLEAIEA